MIKRRAQATLGKSSQSKAEPDKELEAFIKVSFNRIQLWQPLLKLDKVVDITRIFQFLGKCSSCQDMRKFPKLRTSTGDKKSKKCFGEHTYAIQFFRRFTKVHLHFFLFKNSLKTNKFFGWYKYRFILQIQWLELDIACIVETDYESKMGK